jgi:hypothetical protein
MKKRGQITIFVIIALVILIIAGFAIYFFNRKEITVTTPPERDEVTAEVKPLQGYVEACTNSLATESIVKLGSHGGYIDPNDPYLSGRLFVGEPLKQYESDLAYFSPKNVNSAVAYWYYSYSMVDCNNCLMMSQAPYIDEIERQISLYVSENLDSCIRSFESFKDLGFRIEFGDTIFVKTTLRDQDVIIESIYPINVTTGDTTIKMEKFYTVVDIPLMKYYQMALNITRAQYEYGFLENLDLYLIHAYSGFDGKYLPPMYAYTNNYDLVYWSKTQTKNRVNDLLITYTPMLQVSNTKTYKTINPENLTLYEQNFYTYLNIDLFNHSMPNTEISFVYLGEGIYVDVNPSNGELLGPYTDVSGASEISFLPPSQVNIYQFFYDVSHPIIVEINDEYKPGENYKFVFALESNIKENLKLKDWWNASNRPLYFDPEFFKRTFNDQQEGTKLNNSDNTKQYNYKKRTTENLFCEDNQKLSGEMTLKTYDAVNNEPLLDVSVTFGCGNFVNCPLGRTIFNSTTGYVLFKDKLPICQNGYILLEKDGYQNKKIPLTTSINQNKNIGSIYLEPIIKKNLTVKRFEIARRTRTMLGNDFTLGYIISNTSYKLHPNDTVSLTFERILSGTLDEPYSQSIMLTGQDNFTTIELIPGRYILKGQLIDERGFTVPKECKEICVDTEPLNPFGGEECRRVPPNDIPIIPAAWGGIQFTNQTPISITRTDITSNTSIELYVFRIPDPRCLDDMQEGGMTESFSKMYRSKLLPKFKVMNQTP